MPEKLHRCVNDVKGQGKSEDSAYAICNDSITETNTKFLQEVGQPLDIIIEETHNPLDIPFGYEVKEVNNGVKSEGGINDPTEEGGLGSGRNPEGGQDSSGGQPGPLMTFEAKVVKEILDAKVNCPCTKNKK